MYSRKLSHTKAKHAERDIVFVRLFQYLTDHLYVSDGRQFRPDAMPALSFDVNPLYTQHPTHAGAPDRTPCT